MSSIYHVSFLCEFFLIGHLPPFSPDSIPCIPSQMQPVSRLHFHFIRNIPPFVSTNTFSCSIFLFIFYGTVVT